MDQEDPPATAVPLLLPRPAGGVVRPLPRRIRQHRQHQRVQGKYGDELVPRLLQRRSDHPDGPCVRDAVGRGLRHGYGVRFLGQTQGRADPSLVHPPWEASERRCPDPASDCGDPDSRLRPRGRNRDGSPGPRPPLRDRLGIRDRMVRHLYVHRLDDTELGVDADDLAPHDVPAVVPLDRRDAETALARQRPGHRRLQPDHIHRRRSAWPNHHAGLGPARGGIRVPDHRSGRIRHALGDDHDVPARGVHVETELDRLPAAPQPPSVDHDALRDRAQFEATAKSNRAGSEGTCPSMRLVIARDASPARVVASSQDPSRFSFRSSNSRTNRTRSRRMFPSPRPWNTTQALTTRPRTPTTPSSPNRRVVCWIPWPAGSGLSTKSRTAPRRGSRCFDSKGRTSSDATVTRGSPLRWNRYTARTFFSSARERAKGRANKVAAGTNRRRIPNIRTSPSGATQGLWGSIPFCQALLSSLADPRPR